MELSIRKKGLGKMVTGFLALIGASYFVFWLQTKGYSPNSFAMIGLGMLVVILAIALLFGGIAVAGILGII